MPRKTTRKRTYEPLALSIDRLKAVIKEEPGLYKKDYCKILGWRISKFATVRRAYHDQISGPEGGNPIVCGADHRYYFDGRDASNHDEWIAPRNTAIRAEVRRLDGTCDRSEKLHSDSQGVQTIRLLSLQLGELDRRLAEIEETVAA